TGIALFKRRLESISSKLEIIHGNIYSVIRRLTSRYDLILIGGVFDYLKDNVIAVILKELVNRMKKEGTLFFTNIASGNPYRISMEYLSDWIDPKLVLYADVHILTSEVRCTRLHSSLNKIYSSWCWQPFSRVATIHSLY
ncbi:MAG TPA: class I SAM-dependent methyltransferase, partial [Niastella sp.]|nr:class I SAM-dependent methyltransferase [Niastella sp.]